VHPPERVTYLKARVTFNGRQFKIQNKDTFDWTDVKLTLNDTSSSSGYICRVDRIAAGKSYAVSAREFATPRGERFDLATHKPMSFRISCTPPPVGRYQPIGIFSGSWGSAEDND
jgi:hypothetical protein